MGLEAREHTTRVLAAAARGGEHAVAELSGLVYDQLRDLAAALLRRERAGHTLQPTALVHEAFIRLIDSTTVNAADRAHFVAIAAGVMRRVLIDHARAHGAAKRGGGRRLTLRTGADIAKTPEVDVLDLDDALSRLAQLDERQAKVVELRFFGGLTMDEVATVLGLSKRSVEADWALARAWLHRELAGDLP